MKITLNGQEKQVTRDLNLKLLIQQYRKNPTHVIAEHNGVIVRNSNWLKTS